MRSMRVMGKSDPYAENTEVPQRTQNILQEGKFFRAFSGSSASSALGCWAFRSALSVQQLQRTPVDVLEWLDVGHAHVFVDLVDGGVHRPELDHLRADARDEAAVAGAAGGGQLGLDA